MNFYSKIIAFVSCPKSTKKVYKEVALITHNPMFSSIYGKYKSGFTKFNFLVVYL